jgi:hypothetical protein
VKLLVSLLLYHHHLVPDYASTAWAHVIHIVWTLSWMSTEWVLSGSLGQRTCMNRWHAAMPTAEANKLFDTHLACTLWGLGF